MAASAVARAWGDKVTTWWTDDMGGHVWIGVDPGHNINIFAGGLVIIATCLILGGVRMSKVWICV